MPGDPRDAEQPAGHPHRRRPRRRARRRRQLPGRAAGSRHRRAVSRRAAVRGGAARDRRPPGHHLRPAAAHAAAERRSRSRADCRARPHRRPGAVGAVGRLQLAAGLADLRARRSVPGDDAGRPGIPAEPGGAVDALRAGLRQPPDPAVRGRDDAADGRSAVDQPHRPAPLGHAVVQPAAWRRPWRRAGARAGDGARRRCRPRSWSRRRAPRRRSRNRCAASAGSWRSRSS